MPRRRFLVRGAALAGAICASGQLAATAKLPDRVRTKPAAPLRPAAVVTAVGRDHQALLRRALRRLGVLTPGMCAGKRVLLKPTLAWRRSPRSGANVSPDVLDATVRALLEARAARVVICDRTCGRAERVHLESGAADVVERIADPRVELRVLRTEDFVPLELSGADLAAAAPAGWRVNRFLLESDVVVNLAAARVHPTQRVALGMANLRGLVGGARGDAHWEKRRDLELAVLLAAVRPELTILDATRPVVRNGPAGIGECDCESRNTLIASRDPLAVEAAGARLFGLEAADLPWVRCAGELGLGSPELRRGREVRI